MGGRKGFNQEGNATLNELNYSSNQSLNFIRHFNLDILKQLSYPALQPESFAARRVN
jgi:hypothetical protein